jgi:DNA-binding XRE family transcriptional regulator
LKIKVKQEILMKEMCRKFLSQKDLAEQTNISAPTINTLYHGGAISILLAKKICLFFERNFDEMFDVVEDVDE